MTRNGSVLQEKWHLIARWKFASFIGPPTSMPSICGKELLARSSCKAKGQGEGPTLKIQTEVSLRNVLNGTDRFSRVMICLLAGGVRCMLCP